MSIGLDMETILNGFPISNRNCVPDRNRCPYCKDSGYEIVYKYHPEFYGPKAPPIEYTAPCRMCNGKRPNYDKENRNRLKLPYDAFLSAFNPMAYKDAQGDTIDFSHTFKFIRKYIEKFPKIQTETSQKGLYIYSKTTGTGKTLLASIVCNEIYSRYQLMPVYMTETDLLDEIGKEVSSVSMKPKDVIKKAQLLFIDDLWRKRSGREWLIDELFSIIDYRYTQGLCTIITSNISLADKSTDARIAGRLNEMCTVVPMPEVEIRKTKRQENSKELNDILKEEE